MAGNVVANCSVGFGPPLTTTVGTPPDGVTVGVEVGVVPAARMEKRFEVACITPCVELMKMRK